MFTLLGSQPYKRFSIEIKSMARLKGVNWLNRFHAFLARHSFHPTYVAYDGFINLAVLDKFPSTAN